MKLQDGTARMAQQQMAAWMFALICCKARLFAVWDATQVRLQFRWQ